MGSTDKEAVSSFPETLKAIIEEGGYSSQTIFNVDKTGLFRKMPKKTFIVQEERTFPGFKSSKDQLTVKAGGNTAGDCKLKPLLIYCPQNPKALKNESKAGLSMI